jgi:threonine dehydrogenase-like Zn-dependent dehydrogenase
VLVTGLGPVGMAAAMLARALGATLIVGTDVSADRRRLALDLGLVDSALPADEQTQARLQELTGGRGFTNTLDCSGNPAARHLALASTATWGRCAFVGEGGDVAFDVSQLLIHRQVTLHGSWVTSIGHMEELLQQLDRWRLRPSAIVTDEFRLEDAALAYQVADRGSAGKVVITYP